MQRRIFVIGLGWAFLILCLSPSAADAQAKSPFFPEISGWQLLDSVQVFSPENLYDYIDGAADLYLTYDFQELKVAEFKRESKETVIVEIYRHSTPQNAFGIYSQERLANADFLDIGEQGYYEEKVLNFLNGPYYVKISSSNTGSDDREILIQFAKKVAANLGEKKGFPALLRSFPEEGKIKNAEKFIGKNFLGYSFFRSAFVVDYNLAGQKFKLFLMEGTGADDCRTLLQRYFQQIKRPQENITQKRYSISDPYHGEIELFWKGKYIGGVLNAPPSPLRSQFLSSFEDRVAK